MAAIDVSGAGVRRKRVMEMMGLSRTWRTLLVVSLVALTVSVSAAASLTVTVVDRGTGAALSGAVVAVVSGASVPAAGRTNAQGVWTWNGASGNVTIIATKDLHVTQARAVNAGETASLRFELAQHKQEDFKRLGRIVGFVKSANGQPLGNATLILLKGAAPVGAAQPENATGVYELEWYAPGTYAVLATAPGHANSKFTNQTIAAGESLWLDVTLQPK